MVDRVVFVAKDVIEENKKLAMRLKGIYDSCGITALEFLGGPGSGKTTLIERLLEYMVKDFKSDEIVYIGGDVATTFDTERISSFGVHTIQINTGGTCHLEVPHIEAAIERLGGIEFLKKRKFLIIENVGNMICPFSFPLGAHARIMVADVAEGVDKFLKHPLSTLVSDIIIINKIDLAEYIGINVNKMIEDAHRINPKAPVFLASAKTRQGINDVYNTLISLSKDLSK
ncbi:MAG: hydrogenase nickel incorporation protein HypB [Caldisphaeraceae archaeon]|nr:hydrogenase nickel incorporation protein HypB [Caldisphaeraceae archaeon]